MLLIKLNVRSVQAVFAVCIKAGIMKEKETTDFSLRRDKDSGEECENEAITDRQQIYSAMDIHRLYSATSARPCVRR